MLKTFSFIFFILLFVSCGKSGGGGNSTSKGDTISLDQISVDSPVPSAAQNFHVNYKLGNFNAGQEDKVVIAADLIEKVVGSEEFKNAILNHTYNGKKTFVDNRGLSNAEIYKTILEGREKLFPKTDNEMDLNIDVFTRSDSTVGYTMPNVIKIWMNSKFLDKFAPAQVSGNMMHEWLHKLGFDHAYVNNPARPYSVPYAVGYLVVSLASRM